MTMKSTLFVARSVANGIIENVCRSLSLNYLLKILQYGNVFHAAF